MITDSEMNVFFLSLSIYGPVIISVLDGEMPSLLPAVLQQC